MKKTTLLSIIISILLIILVLFFVFKTDKKPVSTQIEKETTENTEPSTAKRILSASVNENCIITVQTSDEKLDIATEYSNEKSYTKYNCLENEYVLHKISPSQAYFAYTDLSGGLDTSFKVYSGVLNKTFTLYTLGPRDIFSLEFLPQDYLVILSGYKQETGTNQEAKLTVINIKKIFKDYPASIESNTLKNPDEYIKTMPVSIEEGKITRFELKDGYLRILAVKTGETKETNIKQIPYKTLTN